MPREGPARVSTHRPARRPPPREEREWWLEELTERADPFMAWLGVVFALLVGYELTVEVGAHAAEWLRRAGWAIWGVFLLEYAAKLLLAPDKPRYVRRHWFQALALAVPTLRVLRFVRLLRLGRALPATRVLSSSYRSMGTARRLFRSRLGYLAATGAIVAMAVAQVTWLFERDHPEQRFASFGDTLLWALAAVLALQADPVPASVGGRLAMLGGFLFGLVVIASLAGTVGAYLVEERQERARAEGAG